MVLSIAVPTWDVFHWSAFIGIVGPICTFLTWGYHMFKKKIFLPWKEQNEIHHREDIERNKVLSQSIDKLTNTVDHFYNEFDKRFTKADVIHTEQQKHLEKHDDQILVLQQDNYYIKKNIGIGDDEKEDDKQ